MRTTVNLDEDVLSAVKELARSRQTSIGKELSFLVRQALQGASRGRGDEVAGFEPFPAEGRLITNDLISRLRDKEGI